MRFMLLPHSVMAEKNKTRELSQEKQAIGDARLLDVKLLGSSEPVKWEQTEQGLLLTPPQTKPCDYAYAFKLSFDSPVGSSLPSEMVDVPFTHGN